MDAKRTSMRAIFRLYALRVLLLSCLFIAISAPLESKSKGMYIMGFVTAVSVHHAVRCVV